MMKADPTLRHPISQFSRHSDLRRVSAAQSVASDVLLCLSPTLGGEYFVLGQEASDWGVDLAAPPIPSSAWAAARG
jgi:hypothetical protein